MFACPVHSYITYQSPARENLNIKIKFVHSMSFYIFMSTILSSPLNRVISLLYIYVLLVSRLKSDNVWSFNALSVPFMPSFHYIPRYFIWVSIVHGAYIFYCFYYYHVMITTRLDLGGG